VVSSMTGFGASSREFPGFALSVEVKSVNGRFLKVGIKGPGALASREHELEGLIKRRLHRGTVSMTVHFERQDAESMVAVNEDVALAYHSIFQRLGLPPQNVAQLPGVVGHAQRAKLDEEQWAALLDVAGEALSALIEMRDREGTELKRVVLDLCNSIQQRRMAVSERAPAVVYEYQRRLEEKITALLDGSDTVIDSSSLAREIAIFAERSDVTEELDRLGAHLTQAKEMLSKGGEIGRPLEFLAQEMLREVNTIGSKSSDREISQAVVLLKADVERIKEQVANIE